MWILKPKPRENPKGTAKPPRKEQGNKKQWEQELDGEASLNRFEKDGRSFRVIAAEHFSKQAARFFQEIEREITDPETWLFLVEGKDTDIYECVIAREIAKEKNIPIEDPVFHPFQAEVINLYLNSDRRKKIPWKREIIIGELAAKVANARGTSDLKEVATVLGVASSEELPSCLYLAVKEKEKDPEKYSAYSKQMFDDLVKISNAVSAQVLNYYLRQYPTRTNIALYLGKIHEEIVTMDVSQIPDDLKFSDEQIRDLLNRRERAKKEIFSAPEPVANREEQETIQEPSEENRITEILETSNIPENLKPLIKKWWKSLFGLEYVRRRGYKEYLDSNNSLHQLWGAAALLAERVDQAELENRELTPEEIKEIKMAFLKAANSRRNEAAYSSQGDEIEKLAENVPYLVKIIKGLKSKD